MQAFANVGLELAIRCTDTSKVHFFIDNLLVRMHFIIVMIWWTGLAPWEFESPFPDSLTSTSPHTGAKAAADHALARARKRRLRSSPSPATTRCASRKGS